MREKPEAAFLRRRPQGEWIQAHAPGRQGGRDDSILRLQTYRQRTEVRRRAQQTSINSGSNRNGRSIQGRLVTFGLRKHFGACSSEDRALASGARSRRFDSCHAHHIFEGVGESQPLFSPPAEDEVPHTNPVTSLTPPVTSLTSPVTALTSSK